MSVRAAVDCGADLLHFWRRARPDAVNPSMLLCPLSPVLDAVEEFALITLSVGPAVGPPGNLLARFGVVDGIPSGEIVLSSLDELSET